MGKSPPGAKVSFWDTHQYTATTVLLGWRSEIAGQRPHGLEAI